MRTIGVVGASGQIGNGVARLLSQRSTVQCVAICRNRVSAAFLKLGGLTTRVVDVAAHTETSEAELADLDVVINCALETGDPSAALAKNKALLSGLLRWLNQRPGRTLIHLGTISSLGATLTHPAARPKEIPSSAYGWQKKMADDFLRRAPIRHGNRLCLWRVGGVYGSEQLATTELVGIALDRTIKLPMDGRMPSNLVSLEVLADCIEAYATDDRLPSGMCSIHDRPNRSWGEVMDIVSNAIGIAAKTRLSVADSLRFFPSKPLDLWGALQAGGRRAVAGLAAEGVAWLRGPGAWCLIRMPLQIENKIRSRYDLKLAAAGVRGAAEQWTIPAAFFNGSLPAPSVGDFVQLPPRPCWLTQSRDELQRLACLIQDVPVSEGSQDK